MRLPAALLLSTALSTALLAGCSGGGTSTAGSPAPTATPSPTASPTASPVPLTGVETVEGLSHDHLGKRSDYPHRYDRHPAVGGPHAPRWLRCDVYTEAVPEEGAVHSEEHGGVWVTYRPGLPPADVQALAALQGLDEEYVLVSPYPGLTSPVVVSTWGHQLRLDSASDPRLAQFVRTFAGGGQGGEKGAPCRTNGLTPAQFGTYVTSLP